MLKNKKKKKKGFTLIELVIVLAVLAIIALIAIPNFTRVRNNALIQADNTSSEQITNITQTAISEGVVKPVLGTPYTLTITFDASGAPQVTTTMPFGKDAAGTPFDATTLADEHYRDIEAPQVNGQTQYDVTIDDKGRVSTVTGTGTP